MHTSDDRWLRSGLREANELENDVCASLGERGPAEIGTHQLATVAHQLECIQVNHKIHGLAASSKASLITTCRGTGATPKEAPTS